MKRYLLALLSLVATVVLGASAYNQFSPGGALFGTWNSQSVDLTASTFLTGPLGATKGGTGQTVFTQGDLLYASSTTALSKLNSVATGSYLKSNGVGAAPSWGTVASLGDNPTASLGLTAIDGVASTYMRSDAAPALSQSISPTWSGTHTFSNAVTGASFIPTSSSAPTNGMYLSAANTVAFSSNSTQRATVNSTGNWNIPTTSSGTTFTINSTVSDDGVYFTSGSGNDFSTRFYRPTSSNGAGLGRLYWRGQNGSSTQVDYARIDSSITTNTAGSHQGKINFLTANAGTLQTPFTIDGDTVNVGSLLSMSDNHGFSAGNVNIYTSSAPQFLIGLTNSGTFKIITNGSTRIEALSTGAVDFPSISTTASAANAYLDSGSSNNLLRSTSSRRYKSDITPISLSKGREILDLQPIRYHSKAEADDKNLWWYGLVAEDVAEVEPRLVSYDKDGLPDGVQYDRIGVFLLKVVQDQDNRIKELESQVKALSRRH